MEIKPEHTKLALFFVPIGIGLCCLLIDALQYQEGISSLNWPEAPGKILKLHLKLVRLDLDHMSYVPSIEYSYHVKDRAYRGNRLTYPDPVLTHETPKMLFKKFALGNEITAYYDPQNIQHSTLNRGVRKSAFGLLFLRDFCITLFTPAIWLFFYARRQRNQKDNPLNFSVET